MNQKHLLRFIKSKLKRSGNEIVTTRDGALLTLADVFRSLKLTAYVSPRGCFRDRVAATPRPRRGYFSDASRRRRGRDVDISLMHRGDAAAATWRRVAATPRPRRG